MQSLTQAQKDEWHRIENEYDDPPEFAYMDLDGNCFDSEGHSVEFEYRNEEDGDDEDDEDYEQSDDDNAGDDDNNNFLAILIT